MKKQTVEQIFKENIVKPFVEFENQKEIYLDLEKEYSELEKSLASTTSYIESKQIEEKLKEIQEKLESNIKEYDKPKERFLINTALINDLQDLGKQELEKANTQVEHAVNDMMTYLKQAVEQYENVLSKQLEVEKTKARVNYLNSVKVDNRNVENIKHLRYSANNYTEPGTFNYTNTPQYFGRKLITMLNEKANKEKIYSEGI